MFFVPAPEPTSEIIWFDLRFAASYWNQPPWVRILVDNDLMFDGAISQEQQQVLFQKKLEFGQHTITIVRTGKTADQTKQLDDNSFATQTLELTRLQIDRTDVRNLIWHDSIYTPEYPEPWASQQKELGIQLEPQVKGELLFGHNGTWTFDFSSPFYMFMVDRITK